MMTKKEFKKKCKDEKTTSYKLMLLGGILAVIGFMIVVITMFFMTSIIGYIIGGIIAFTGMVLDFAGEVMISKEYKQYQ